MIKFDCAPVTFQTSLTCFTHSNIHAVSFDRFRNFTCTTLCAPTTNSRPHVPPPMPSLLPVSCCCYCCGCCCCCSCCPVAFLRSVVPGVWEGGGGGDGSESRRTLHIIFIKYILIVQNAYMAKMAKVLSSLALWVSAHHRHRTGWHISHSWSLVVFAHSLYAI